MERLTHERVNGIKTGYWSKEKKQDLVDGLAAYENTGMTVKEIKEMKRGKEWVLKPTYEQAKAIIRTNIEDMSKGYIANGYYLKQIEKEKLYGAEGYDDLYAFAEAEFGMKRPTVNHCIRINAEFSNGGNSPYVSEKYKKFSRSQLQELLYLSEEQREEIKPEMTVKEIRKKRKKEEPEKQGEEPKKPEAGSLPDSGLSQEEAAEPLSALGFPRRIKKENSLIYTPGCGKYDCDSCSRECQIRQQDRRCRLSTYAENSPCEQVEGGLKELERSAFADRCMFVHLELAPVRRVDKEPSPCCLECNVEECMIFRCEVSRKIREAQREEARKQAETAMNLPEELPGSTSSGEEGTEAEMIEPRDAITFAWDRTLIEKQLEIEKRNLTELRKLDEEIPEVAALRQEALVLGLRALLRQAEEREEA